MLDPKMSALALRIQRAVIGAMQNGAVGPRNIEIEIAADAPTRTVVFTSHYAHSCYTVVATIRCGREDDSCYIHRTCEYLDEVVQDRDGGTLRLLHYVPGVAK